MVSYAVKMVVLSGFPDVSAAIIELLENAGMEVDYLSVEDEDGELSSEYINVSNFESEVL